MELQNADRTLFQLRTKIGMCTNNWILVSDDMYHFQKTGCELTSIFSKRLGIGTSVLVFAAYTICMTTKMNSNIKFKKTYFIMLMVT